MDQSTTQSIRRIRSGRRKQIAKTKSRAEVSGGGKKPWRQKGTGNARVGSTRSPLWRGGGKSFGSRHQNHSIMQNSKEITHSIKKVITNIKTQIISADQIKTVGTKTKNMQALLNELKVSHNQILVIYNQDIYSLFRAAKNINNVNIRHQSELNAYDLLNCQLIVTSQAILDGIKNKS